MENNRIGAVEVAPGLTSEEMKALFFDGNALREPSYRLFQLNSDGHRYYYRFDGDDVRFYPSVTTLIKQVLPTSPALIDWMIANGKDGSIEKRDLAAAYGTFMHIQFESLIINRRYNFDDVPNLLSAYMERENLPEKVFNEWLTKARKDVLSFAQFVKDWNVRAIAVEIGLCSENGFAGCVDLPCIMTDPKTGKEFRAIVDFKSGRKGFFEEHEIQLHLYKMMFVENFPDCPIERVFNFSPKDWRKKPTYNLKDQTDAKSAKKIPYILGLASVLYESREDSLTIISGEIDIDSGNLDSAYKTVTLADVVKTKRAPESTETPEISTNALNPDNVPSEGKSGGNTDLPFIFTGADGKHYQIPSYDICQFYCDARNCDYCLGNHQPKCSDAIAKAKKAVEPDHTTEDLFNDELPF